MKTLIIGYGNTLRRDDGLGIYAAEEVAHRGLPVGVAVLTCQQLTPELAADLAEVDRVAFLDASAPSGQPGRITQSELLPCATSPSGITHHFGPETLLALAGALYGHTPQATLFTIEAESFELGEGLTDAVAAALPQFVQKVWDWVGRN
jgi:hydrogenase maturation protease